MHVIFTGTKSSLTCVHFTVPELDVVTWNTSAQSRQMGILKMKKVFYILNISLLNNRLTIILKFLMLLTEIHYNTDPYFSMGPVVFPLLITSAA